MSFAQTENLVIMWGTDRGIVQNSNNMAQAIKTLEEVTELIEAIHKGDKAAQIDAYGDILVTLIIGCATADLDLVSCLDAQGVFHKVTA